MTWAATGAVSIINVTTATTRAVTATSINANATPIIIKLVPRAPALVEACMRVGRSGRRKMPKAARNISAAPVSMQAETIHSIIPGTSQFQKASETYGSQERHQCQHNGNIEKADHTGFDSMHPDSTRDNGRHELQRHDAVGQRGAFCKTDKRKQQPRQKHEIGDVDDYWVDQIPLSLPGP